MRAAASVNPLHYLVDAERSLFAGDVASTAVVGGLVAAVATAVARGLGRHQGDGQGQLSLRPDKEGTPARGPLLGMMGP